MKSRFIVFQVVGVLLLAYWWYILVLPTLTPTDYRVRVHFLDVGQGDAILIETPDRRQILVDAGRSIKILDRLQEILPMSDVEIDVLVMTHPDADHIGGFVPIIKRYTVNTIIRSFANSNTGVYKALLKEIEQSQEEDDTAVHIINRAYTFSLDGVQFDILWPLNEEVKETNAASVVLLMTYGDMKVLLTGDANAAVEDLLVNVFPNRTEDVDILKAGHHGSKTSTSELFLTHTKPDAIVYSASKNNRYGHPHDIVKERVANYGNRHPEENLRDYWTATDGTISFCLTHTSFQVCE